MVVYYVCSLSCVSQCMSGVCDCVGIYLKWMIRVKKKSAGKRDRYRTDMDSLCICSVKLGKYFRQNATHLVVDCTDTKQLQNTKHTWTHRINTALISPAYAQPIVSRFASIAAPHLFIQLPCMRVVCVRACCFSACTAHHRKINGQSCCAIRQVYAARMDWMIWKIAEPQTTNRKSASSHGPTGYWSSLVFCWKKKYR